MSEFPHSLIKEASECLSLNDIVLYESRFERSDHDLAGEGTQQQKLTVNHALAKPGELREEAHVFQVMVGLGVQVVSNESSEDENMVFRIEADFIAEYNCSSEISDEAAQAFAEFNAVHNIWPFWRQHVYDVVNRARLPKLDIPLMKGRKIK